MSKDNGPKYKIRQFQWFQMQTRVRQMVHQLILPFQKRIMESSTTLISLKSFTAQQAHKLQQLRLMVTNDPNSKDISIFKTIDKKFQQQYKHIMQLKNLVIQQTKMVEKRFILQDERLKQNGQILLNNMQLKQRVNEQIKQQNQNITQFRKRLQQMIVQVNNSIHRNNQQLKQFNKKSIDRDYNLEDRIKQLQKFKKITDQKFILNQQKHNQFQRQIIHANQTFKKINQQIYALNQNFSYTKKLSNYVQQLQEKLKQQDYSLQILNPLITQAQISDNLYTILPPKLRRRLIIQEYQKYNKLNTDVLQNDSIKKQSKVKFNGMEMLQLIQKRNARQMIEMKRKKLLGMGIDIDNMTYEQRQKHYRQVTFNEQFIDQGEDKVKIDTGIQQGQILKLIEQQLQGNQKRFSEKIKIQTQDSKRYILQMQQQIERQLKQTNKRIQKCNQFINIFQTDQILQNKHIQQLVFQRQKQNNKINHQLVKINQNLFSFIQFCSLVNHLQIQDQLDKQSISLFGIKQTFNQNGQGRRLPESQNKKKIIDFNAQCFSCCGYPASTIAAFKMACLTYNPSQILIQSKQYKREQILEISTKILQYIKNRLSNAPNKVMPQQVQDPKKSWVGSDQQIEVIKINGAFQQLQRNESRWKKIRKAPTSATSHSKVGGGNRNSIKSATKRKQDLGNISYIFSQNKRKNLAFLV